MSNKDVLLRLENICKYFPGVKALENVNICIESGKIHALCGENGAGKSTLIKILCGIYSQDEYEGSIYMDGELQRYKGIKDAEKSGIICIHQELALVQEMSVVENIFLGNEDQRMGILNENSMYEKAKKILERLHLNIDPREKVANLGIGHQQMIEIAKALSKNAKVLILDEPTSALTEQESANLLKIIKQLQTEGVTSIYISHKLDEVYSIADQISVIRDGEYIGTQDAAKLTKDQLIKMMVGRDLDNLYPRRKRIKGDIKLEVQNYTVFDKEHSDWKVVDNVSFKVHQGEILGISGLMGAGRTELVSSLFGVYESKSEGRVIFEGKEMSIDSAVEAINKGFALVSEDRKTSGLFLDMTIKENINMVHINRKDGKTLLQNEMEFKNAQEYMKSLKIKAPSMHSKVGTLSGGNQQKVVIGKWLLNNPKVLILDEPTRGIDIGAKYEIYEIMNDLVDAGVLVIMISSELEEVLGMSDRVLVLAEGKLTADLPIEEATQEKVIYYATGGQSDE